MPLPSLTVDEIVETLRRSQVPTLLVEGTSDACVYRLLERRFSLSGGAVLSCNGRSNLLGVFHRRNEAPRVRKAFLADQDLWLFLGLPGDLSDVIFTSGYSIENDILDGPSIERLMDESERSECRMLIDELCRWFAFELDVVRSGGTCILDIHVNRLIPIGTGRLSERWCADRGYSEPSSATLSDLRANWRLGLRGKQILQVFARVLNASTRTSKFSINNILEIAATSPEHVQLDRISGAIQSLLASPNP